MLKKGDMGYIVENNSRIIQVTILSVSGNLYTIKMRNGAIRLPKHRIFQNELDAQASIVKEKTAKKQYRSPYDYI
ncbi:hypothetical protein [Hungatella hathewayi]|uniref:hypothetical protein n=1 Tax=Hungatella hathewayi TaxID=154046 RepID=UPI00356835CB